MDRRSSWRQHGPPHAVTALSHVGSVTLEVMEVEGEGGPRRARADDGHDDVLEAGGGEAGRPDVGERR